VCHQPMQMPALCHRLSVNVTHYYAIVNVPPLNP
jgi:hypothetical protein